VRTCAHKLYSPSCRSATHIIRPGGCASTGSTILDAATNVDGRRQLLARPACLRLERVECGIGARTRLPLVPDSDRVHRALGVPTLYAYLVCAARPLPVRKRRSRREAFVLAFLEGRQCPNFWRIYCGAPHWRPG
jgi:hypothetical protein